MTVNAEKLLVGHEFHNVSAEGRLIYLHSLQHREDYSILDMMLLLNCSNKKAILVRKELSKAGLWKLDYTAGIKRTPRLTVVNVLG
jgi:hypothetical protein